MDPTTPTEKLDVNGEPGAGEAATAQLPAVTAPAAPPAAAAAAANGPQQPTAPVKPPLASSAGERCPLCGSALAPDQRYCVECGQRLSGARPALMNDRQRPAGDSSPPPKKRWRWSPNATLLAGIATLLLAMGVGILIGYLGHGTNAKSPARQLVYVPSGGASGAASTGAIGATSSTPATAKTPKSTAAAASGGGAKAAPTKPTQEATKPPNPTVKLGDTGSGPGYHSGHFTGGFFGSGSQKEEEGTTEEEGVENESSGSGKNGGKK